MFVRKHQVEEILEDLKYLRKAAKRSLRVAKHLNKLRKRRLKILEEIKEKIMRYHGLREMQLGREEKNLLKKLEHVLHREKGYLSMLPGPVIKVLRRIRRTLDFSTYQIPIVYDVVKPMTNLCEIMLSALEGTRGRLSNEIKFVKRWRGAGFFWHARTFWQKEDNLFKNFKSELEGLFNLNKEFDKFILNEVRKISLGIIKVRKAGIDLINRYRHTSPDRWGRTGSMTKKLFRESKGADRERLRASILSVGKAAKETSDLAADVAKGLLFTTAGQFAGDLIDGKNGGAVSMALGLSSGPNTSKDLVKLINSI